MRLEARIKMGYYPTPLSVVERIKGFLKFPDTNVNLLDPCCGKGIALKMLKGNNQATTYGVELDEHRAKKAKQNLDYVIKGNYKDARISNNAFSCLFLNPPYDWQACEEDKTEREEKTFLKDTIKYLQALGILIYIIPQKRLTKDIAQILSYNFENFNVFKFPDNEFEAYKQIVLFASKKHRASISDKEYERLKIIPDKELEEISYVEKPIYNLPCSDKVQLFRSSAIDESELEKELKNSVLWKRLKENTNTNNDYIGRPPLPLHKGHLGLLLANGYLDGIVGERDEKHIVRGKVEKVVHKLEEYEGNTLIEREVENYRVSIKILKRNGEIVTLV